MAKLAMDWRNVPGTSDYMHTAGTHIAVRKYDGEFWTYPTTIEPRARSRDNALTIGRLPDVLPV